MNNKAELVQHDEKNCHIQLCDKCARDINPDIAKIVDDNFIDLIRSNKANQVPEIDKLINYLCGSSDYDGSWYGDGTIPRGKRGMFWWRKDLLQLLSQSNKRAEIERLERILSDLKNGGRLTNYAKIKAYLESELNQLKEKGE